MPVRVLTDSTADLPPELLRGHDITVVPLQVGPGERTTSQPSPAALAEAFAATAGTGGSVEVVAVHLSAGLSGTFAASCRAATTAAASGLQVRVVDSGLTSMGLGFVAIAAARAAAAGAAADQVVAAAQRAAGRTRLLFSVETLEHLRRGGRIGAASALLGSALAVKPLLQVVEGRIAVREKVRTTSRALARMVELATADDPADPGAAGAAPEGPGAEPGERRPGSSLSAAVMHLGQPERAEELGAAVRRRLPAVDEVLIVPLGAVVAVHTGPGALGLAVTHW